MSEPLPVIPLEYAKPDDSAARRRKTWRTAVRVFLLLSWACCAVAWGLIVYVDVESVLGTGPVLFVLGLALLIGGFVLRGALPVGIGTAHCAVCVLFTALVLLLQWSPGEARWPFSVMGAVYTAGIAGPTLIALLHDSKHEAAVG